MLDNYLEKNIRNKLELLNILHLNESITMKDLLSLFPLSLSNINFLVDELNIGFTGLATIKKNRKYLSISICEGVQLLDLFYSIYQDSNVLQCLKYMILNDANNSLSSFMEEHYISKSTAYRIREICYSYLKCIGLNVERNQVIGEEYRIRFLIALLHYKYGIECYDINDEDINFSRNFIMITNLTIDNVYLKTTINEYGYFEYLLILSWKRKKYPNTPIISSQLEKLKEIFVYKKLVAAVKRHLEPKLKIKFTKNDYDYLFLIYCSTNNVLFADQWTQEHINHLHKIIFSDKIYYDLLQRIENKFGKEVASSNALKASLVYFAKKALLELQCIIPDKNVYIDSKKSYSTKIVHQYISNIFSDWKKKHDIEYEIDNMHLFYLSLQIELIIKQFLEPVSVSVLSELTSERKIISLYLERYFSPKRATIKSMQLDTENRDYLYSQKNSVIVINRKFRYLIEKSQLSKNNIIIPITVELNSKELLLINQAILHYENEMFLNFVNHI
ncbi:TPA: helix-turn-helix domain-containing protein [Clostridioides difficile]|uniref:helix-turn-helix domain-containing protein n=1 Tax=Clostridioides difficile TaxID=1496 RepID=UPI0020C3C6E4|nr:helix-turn-helix domain-containing protein [Clostridioides difficile]EJA6848022.1 helix-turn-helix domain-containing protein [Clostridioides difficile]MCP8332076.1 helix-turn-helix domain-containing protein [Clostridioides difficile]MDU8846723.1 helix-turn-helix domain-containing protein [Clostridioides difficile]